MKTDILIIGSGLAGCAAAWAAAKRNVEVTLVTRSSQPEESNTLWAQGGIIYRGENDSPQRLVADILAAGAGLSPPEAASLLSREGPRLVKDILMPPLGLILGGVNFTDLFISLNGQAYDSLKAAQDAGAPTLNYGLFILATINFLIIAFVIFLIVRTANRLQGPPATLPAEPVTKDCPYCLSSIPLKATRCPHCTSELTA